MKASRRNFIKTGLIYVPVFAGITSSVLGQDARRRLLLKQRASAGAASCNTARDSITHASPTDVGLVGISGIQKRSVAFTAGASYTLCKAILRLDKVGTPSGYLLNVSLWDALGAGGRPGSQIGTQSDDVDANTMTNGTPNAVTFSNISATVVNTTAYNLVLSIGTVNDSNYVRWWNQTYSAATCSMSGGTWNAPDGTPRDLLFELFSS